LIILTLTILNPHILIGFYIHPRGLGLKIWTFWL
jgi:hypothetical protein